MRPPWASDAVHIEQVRSSYAHLPLTLSVSVINGILLGFVLATGVAQPPILIWIGFVIGLSALRLALWYAQTRWDVGPAHSPWWTRLATAGALASGVLWGSSVFVFAPLDQTLMLFLALVIAGMCAGAATVHAAHFPSVIAFIVPAVLPLALNFVAQGTRLHVIAGVMAGIFGVSLCVASLRFQRWFRDTTSARLALASQTLETREANARLSNEMARHRSTELKLQHAQKMEAIGRLTAGIAHDFNNLLMAIGGAVEVLKISVGLDPGHTRLIATIQHSVERGASLTRQLLVFGRGQTLLPRLVDINAMLRGMEGLLAATLGGYGRLELKLGRRPQQVRVDPDQLETSILNLVMNARDALVTGGSVTISVTDVVLRGDEAATEGRIGNYVLMAVSDTGTGMTEQVRLHAFDPFFTTKEPGKGSGLGLSQVYGLVKESGGTIHLDSRPASGTTVSIYLPKATGPAVLPGADRDIDVTAGGVAAASRKGRRIVLVDDDEQVRSAVTEMLVAAGYTVASFAGAAEALDEIDGPHRIDLCIADYAMPTIRGDQFAAEARSRRPDVPVLFITGYADTESLQSERWVLRKPFHGTALIAAIEGAMRIAA